MNITKLKQFAAVTLHQAFNMVTIKNKTKRAINSIEQVNNKIENAVKLTKLALKEEISKVPELLKNYLDLVKQGINIRESQENNINNSKNTTLEKKQKLFNKLRYSEENKKLQEYKEYSSIIKEQLKADNILDDFIITFPIKITIKEVITNIKNFNIEVEIILNIIRQSFTILGNFFNILCVKINQNLEKLYPIIKDENILNKLLYKLNECNISKNLQKFSDTLSNLTKDISEYTGRYSHNDNDTELTKRITLNIIKQDFNIFANFFKMLNDVIKQNLEKAHYIIEDAKILRLQQSQTISKLKDKNILNKLSYQLNESNASKNLQKLSDTLSVMKKEISEYSSHYSYNDNDASLSGDYSDDVYDSRL